MERVKVALPAGGLDERPRPDRGSASQIVNMCLTDGRWRAAPGTDLVLETSDPVTALGWVELNRFGPALLLEAGEPGTEGQLYRVNWEDGTTETIATDRTIVDGLGGRTQFLSQAGWALILNGRDPPIRYNGRRVAPMGFTGPPGPPSLSTGGQYPTDLACTELGATMFVTYEWGSDYQRGVGDRPFSDDITAWRYGYRIAFRNDLGMESPPSAPCWVSEKNQSFAAGTNPRALWKIAVMLQVQLAPDWARQVVFYRTENLGSAGNALGDDGIPFFFLDAVSPVEATTYVDDHPDAELGPLLDPATTGAFPAGAFRGAFFKGRLYLLVKGEPAVRFSEPLLFEQFPDDNVLPVGQRDGGEPVGIFATRDVLVVFKQRGIWLVSDQGDGPSIAMLTEDVGAACGEIAEVPSGGVLFLAEDGPYLLEGASQLSAPTGLRPLVSKIARSWARVNREALASAIVSVHRREKEVWFQVPTHGEVRPTLGLVYHYPSGEWSVRESWGFRCMTETRDGRADLFVGGPLGIYHVDRGYEQTRTVKYRVGPTYFQDRRQLIAMNFWTLETGRFTSIVKRYEDRRLTARSAQIVHTYDVEAGKPDVWDVALWGSGVWGDQQPTLVRADLYGWRAHEYEVELEALHVELMELEAHLDPSEDSIEKLSGGR